MEELTNLTAEDLTACVTRMPKRLRQFIETSDHYMVVAGGFIRTVVGREPASDIDLFVGDKLTAELVAKELAALYYFGGQWISVCAPLFYADLAARRLRYTCPEEPEAAASMLRVMKFLKRGYSIAPESLADILANMTVAIRLGSFDSNRRFFLSTLREIDPLLVVPGAEPTLNKAGTSEGDKEWSDIPF